MKLNRIAVQNFMGVRSLEIKPGAPVVMLVGPNGAGKSSTIEGIRAAMVGRLDRVKLKKDYRALVTEGERIGTVLIDYTGGRCGMTLPNGAHEIEGAPLDHPALPLALDVHQFARLDEAGRRLFLHDLLSIETSPAAIVARLIKEYDCSPALAALVEPLLTNGFDAAAKRAKESVSEARGAWKAVTGEAYGSEKAKKWAPPEVAAPSDADCDTALQAAETARAAADEANIALGRVQAEAKAYAARRERVETLTQQAERLERHREQLARGESELKTWSDKLATLPPEPGAVNLRPPMACPDCGAVLTLRDGTLHPHEAAKPDDADTAMRRKQWGDAVALYTRTVESAKRDILTAERAKVELADIDAATPVLQIDVEAARERAVAARDAHAEAASLLDKQRALRDAADAREGRITEAADHHADVVEWDKLAAALSPEGLRTRLVADAIDPVNQTLQELAELAQWDVPQIGADMQIRVGANARPYPLLSESEQFRVDVLAGLMIAILSGLKLALIDRFDVLDMGGREDLIFLLDELALRGQIEQVFVAGTLKAPPAGLPEHCEAVWIEPPGVLEQQEAA